MALSLRKLGAITLALVIQLLVAGQTRPGMGRPAGGIGQSPAGTAPVPAVSPYVDTHTHFDAKDLSNPDRAVEATLHAMGQENAATLIVMPGPFPPNDPARFEHEAFLAAVKKHRDRLAFQGGGGSLNPMIQESVRSTDAGPEVQRKFRERAEQIVRDGAVGFGEVTAEHLALPPSGAYEYAPPDHPLFLLLADIAAEHGVPIDFHSEAVPQAMPLPFDLRSPRNPSQLHENIAAFGRLLDHNPRAKIVWAHAGSDYTGYRTPDLCRRLLQAHSNLYMEIKIDPLSLGKNPPLANGQIKPEWLKLFQDFPDRFLIGSDQHYGSAQPMVGPQRWQMVALLLNRLPADLRRKIGMGNALRIFPITQTK